MLISWGLCQVYLANARLPQAKNVDFIGFFRGNFEESSRKNLNYGILSTVDKWHKLGIFDFERGLIQGNLAGIRAALDLVANAIKIIL